MTDPKLSQYAELTEDELIELADDVAHLIKADKRLLAIIGALKARRDVTAPARRRVGEYLRQQGITQAEYEADLKSESEYTRKNARKPEDILATVHTDSWAPTAALRLSDLQRLVTPLVRDTKAEFFAEQQARLEAWKRTPEYAKLPEKQQRLLPCVAEGHIERNYRGWRSVGGSNSCCGNAHAATISSLVSKPITASRPKAGFRYEREVLMLADPAKAQK